MSAGVRRLIDIRLNNISAAGWLYKERRLKVLYTEQFATLSTDIFLNLRQRQQSSIPARKAKERADWQLYEAGRFLDLMRARRIESTVSRRDIGRRVPAAGEEEPQPCHRRLVAEYLREHWENVEIERVA